MPVHTRTVLSFEKNRPFFYERSVLFYSKKNDPFMNIKELMPNLKVILNSVPL